MSDFEPQYWCVWNEGGGSPTVRHPTFSTARAEAQRLARLHPGKRFAVLAAATAYVKDDVREVRFEGQRPWDEGVPF